MTSSIPVSAGIAMTVPLSALRLDPENPRIPEAHRSSDQAEMATLLEMGFDAYPVAQSIAELGYFNAEPLIVVPYDREEGTWVVVEGNRRLTALLGLTYQEIRSGFASPERWARLAEKRTFTPEMKVPVVVHTSRETTHPEVARAHVVGKLPWRPYMQARYIAARVDEGRTIQEVADLIGIPKSKAADLYRDQAILKQAADIGLETSQVESAFSLLTVAMGNTKLRNHVGAALGSQTRIGEAPIPEDRTRELQELIQWIFGDEDHEPLISESRQISQLGNVVGSEVGLDALRNGKSLEEAKQRMQERGLDPLKALTLKLTAAKNSLISASGELGEFATDIEIVRLVSDLESLVGSLRATLDELGNSEGA